MSFDIPEPYVWDKSFLVGIAIIDEQHKPLFTGIDACCKDKGNAAKWDSLKGLIVAHFKTEEDMMSGSGCGTLDGHKAIHDDFLNTCNSLSVPLPDSFDDIAKGWLVNHIKGTDQKTKFQ